MKRFAALALASLCALSSQAFAGGGSSGFLFNGLAGDLECVSADGSKQVALKNSISVNGVEVSIYNLKLDVTETVSYLITGSQAPGLRSVAIAVPLTVGSKSTRLTGSPVVTFTSTTDDEAAKLGEATLAKLFARKSESKWIDNDNLVLGLNASPIGLCSDEAAKVQVILTFP
jgi:hypothetical protein